VSRKDVLKSIVRSAVNAAIDPIKNASLPEGFRQALKDILKLRVAVGDRQLTAAAGRAQGVAAVTVSVTDGRIRIDASAMDERRLLLSLIPRPTAFAPRGAKELSFSVEPSAAASDPCALELVSAIAGEIARAIWGPLLPRQIPSTYPAFVEREGDCVRVDLRTVPELRAALRQRGAAIAIDLLEARALVAQPGALRITLGIQNLL
jgi:hypothetical protein